MKSRAALFLLPLISLLSPDVWSQTTLNPDISVIPRFRIESNDSKMGAFSTPQFTMEEVEVAIQGYLNPYARADIYLAKPGGANDPLEVEEAYATVLRGLPLDLNFKVGKYLMEFGKLNASHPHAWSFVSRPASIERFLGEEGVNDVGLSASVLLPTGDLYSRWNVDVFNGNTFRAIDPTSGEVAGGVGLLDTLSSSSTIGVASRISVFLPMGEVSDLEVGFSGMTGIHDPYRTLRYWYGNVDMKYKWKPDQYTSWTIQGEALLNQRRVATVPGQTRSITSGGTYLSIDHQFQKVYSVGARGDWSQAPYSDDDRATGGALWFGYYPVEETLALRLQWQYLTFESPSANHTSVNTVALQIVFSLGPHRAHPF